MVSQITLQNVQLYYVEKDLREKLREKQDFKKLRQSQSVSPSLYLWSPVFSRGGNDQKLNNMAVTLE